MASRASTPVAWASVMTSARVPTRLRISALPSSFLAAARSLRSPWYSSRPVIAASSSFTASKIARGPAASIEPLAPRAASGVMNTGQCRKRSPSAASRAARRAVSSGRVVLWSIRIASARIPGRADAMTASTTASSFSTRCTRSASRTASAGVAATTIPKRARSRALSTDRFQTVTLSPRFAAASAQAPPSSPVPRNAMFAMDVSPMNCATRIAC